MKAIRWIGRGLAAAGLLLTCAVGTAYGIVAVRSARDVTVPPRTPLRVVHDSLSRARGAHLADAIAGCVHCHGKDYGGSVMVDEPLVLRLVAPNLTSGRGGVIARYDDVALERAIRAGVGHDGRLLRLMPSNEFAGLADEDVAAIIADLRARPAVDRDLPTLRLGPVGTALAATKQLKLFSYDEIDHTQRPPEIAPAGVTIERGRYLAAGCFGCHRSTLGGGPIVGGPPDWPPAADITVSGLGSWTESDFIRALRTGTRPDGSQIRAPMPWEQLGHQSDDDLRALWRYLQSVPPARSAPK
jgi:mono/diheme cytochrome c family protein